MDWWIGRRSKNWDSEETEGHSRAGKTASWLLPTNVQTNFRRNRERRRLLSSVWNPSDFEKGGVVGGGIWNKCRRLPEKRVPNDRDYLASLDFDCRDLWGPILGWTPTLRVALRCITSFVGNVRRACGEANHILEANLTVDLPMSWGQDTPYAWMNNEDI